MTENQIEKISTAIELDASYWVLKVTLSDGGVSEVKKWYDVDSNEQNGEINEGAPTVAEVISLTKKYKKALKFTFAAYGPKGVKRLRFVSFDPPNNKDTDQGSELANICDSLAMVVKAQGEETVNVLKAARGIMEESTKQVERFGTFTEKVVAKQLDYERLKHEYEIEKQDAETNDKIHKELMLMQLQTELESAKEKGSIGGQLVQALLEEPQKLQMLIAMGVDTVDKVGDLVKLKLGAE